MKKLIAALAVLAVAAVAQADLLATWNTAGGAVTEAGVEHIQVGELYTLGTVKTTTAGNANIFGVNTMNAEGNGFAFDVVFDDGYEVTEAVLAGTVSGSGTGPGKVDIKVGDATKYSIERDNDSLNSPFSANLGTFSDATVKFLVDVNAGSARSGTAENIGAGGSFYLRTSMTLDGKVQEKSTAVPEPATMSLLGLGALAMVLRRKLRK